MQIAALAVPNAITAVALFFTVRHNAAALEAERKQLVATLDLEREKMRVDAQRARDEKRDAKCAEVAGEVSVAALRLLIAIDTIASTEMQPQPPSDAPAPSVGSGEGATEDGRGPAEFSRRWADAAPTFDAFVDTWNLAQIYLPEHVHDLLEELWRFKAEVRANQMTWFAIRGSPRASPKFFDGGIGPKVHARVKELRAKALGVMRPLAQLVRDTTRNPAGRVNDAAAAGQVGEPKAETARPSARPSNPRE